MGHEVAPALARKFGEPGGLFDTVLQRLVSEWHRFQVDLDPERLATLGAILEAGLSQLRSLELLLRTDDQPEAELELDLDLSRRTDQDVRSVYAADPRAGPEPSPRDRPGELGTLSPSRLDEAMHLLESLQDALQDVLSLGETPPLASSSPEPTHLETRRHRDLPRPQERRSRPDTHRAGEPPAPDLTIESPEPPARSRRPAVARPEPPVGDAQPVAESGDGQSGRPIDEIFPREAFDVASAAELKRCRRFERSFSLLLLDAGVEVDRRAGRILLSNLREFDLVGRYGRDLFAVGLPETSAEGARVIAQRLVGLLARRGAWSDRGRLGFATYPRDGNTLTTVVRSARTQLSGGDPS
jgi:hypothetical protein